MKHLKSGHGGKRIGAGKPKGYQHASTITKEQAREALRDVVIQHMSEMLAAQIEHAKGIKHLMLREDKGSKFERVTDELQIDAAIATGRSFWLFTKDPSVQAFTDLLNRALDKPVEAVSLEANIKTEFSWKSSE